MSLQTRRPPGHANRKALAYAADIVTLREAGHTYESIRQALEDAGVQVSLSTVRREVLRDAPPAAVATAAPGQRPRAARDVNPVATADRTGQVPEDRHGLDLPGRAVAEEFMRGRSTNPLFLQERKK